MQVPWLRQGLDAHSLMLVWQLGPTASGLENMLGLDIKKHTKPFVSIKRKHWN